MTNCLNLVVNGRLSTTVRCIWLNVLRHPTQPAVSRSPMDRQLRVTLCSANYHQVHGRRHRSVIETWSLFSALTSGISSSTDPLSVMANSQMYINILLDTALATDVNKYSLASVRCQPIWRTKSANWIYF